MLPFTVHLQRGQPAHEQVLAAVREALAVGQLRDGDAFPSARVLTQELRISPSAAQKVVTRLREQGFLAQQAGSGLIVRASPVGRATGETVVDPTRGAPSGGSMAFLGTASGPDAMGRIGEYDVVRLIARGGMGLVFEAFDPGLLRRVAIKVLAPEFAASSDARTRFIREARSIAAVDHENILPIHAVGEAGGYPYIVMPLVEGDSLQARLNRDGRLPATEIVRIGLAVARGLAAAHRRGLVHRDIKPENILLDPERNRVWLVDFGLARAVEDHALTRSGVTAGTPHYLSPEQAEGQRVDHRTDLFSLGSALYAMATGRPPFTAETLIAVVRKIIDEPAPSLRDLRPELPTALADLIQTLLAKDPTARPADADELIQLLERIASA